MSEDQWPRGLPASVKEVDVERKSKAIVSCVGQAREPLLDFNRFSNNKRLLGAVAWVTRFVNNMRVKADNRCYSPLTATEIQEAEQWLMVQVQASCFEEIFKAQNNTPSENSRLRNLNPVLCPETGLLRVGGRIHKSLLPEAEKHPIILPSHHYVVKLLILDLHKQELHAGVEHTLSIVRQKFWPMKGRSVVRQTLNGCLVCQHSNTKPFAQRMAPLPADRSRPAPPFTNVGLDFAGPLYLRESNDKAYICLFTCAVTRAVHLELISNMTVERFLQALRRMVARRGMCSIIWSDNAKTFKGASRQLQ